MTAMTTTVSFDRTSRNIVIRLRFTAPQQQTFSNNMTCTKCVIARMRYDTTTTTVSNNMTCTKWTIAKRDMTPQKLQSHTKMTSTKSVAKHTFARIIHYSVSNLMLVNSKMHRFSIWSQIYFT